MKVFTLENRQNGLTFIEKMGCSCVSKNADELWTNNTAHKEHLIVTFSPQVNWSLCVKLVESHFKTGFREPTGDVNHLSGNTGFGIGG